PDLARVLPERAQRTMGGRCRLEVVEAASGSVSSGLGAGMASGLQGGKRVRVRVRDDRRRALREREQRSGLAVAAGGGKVRLAHVLRGQLEPAHAGLALERGDTVGTSDRVSRTGNMSDPAMAQLVEVAERKAYALGVIGANECIPPSAHAHVDADVRHRALPEVGDEWVVPVDADQNGGIEAVVRTELDRLEQQGLVVRAREPAGHRRGDGPE